MGAVEITSLCPFHVASSIWEAKPKQFSLTVAVKATFALVRDGEARVHERQEAMSSDRHWDDRPMASLHAPGDQVPFKRRADVLLSGHAYAPGKKTAASIVVRFAVGDVFEKSIRVTGDRVHEQGSAGWSVSAPKPFLRMPLRYERAELSAENPVGIDTHAGPVLGAPARPNLELVGSAGAVGFGPIASTWRARRKRVDDAGLLWAYGVSSDTPSQPGAAPSNFDFAFFNSAPREQQVDLLRPGMRIELENLNAGHAAMVCTLPSIRPQAFLVQPGGTRGEEVTLRCDTLFVDSDRALLILTFRGVADAGDGSSPNIGRLVVAADTEGKKLRWDRVQKLLEGGAPKAVDARSSGASEPPAPDPLATRYDEVIEGALKAIATASGLRPSLLDDATDKMKVPPVHIEEEPTAAQSRRIPRPNEARALAPTEFALVDPTTFERDEPTLSKPGMEDPETEVLGARATEPHARMEPAEIGRFAAVSAHLARKGIGRAAVLSAHGLSENEFAHLAERWSASLGVEHERGRRDLAGAFDLAYVAAQESLHPPVGIIEFARITVALERGDVGRVLGELDLELSDLMRLQRVWARRAADSPDARRALDRAIEAARGG